jgi:PadR family transcriptional regulator PadR
LYKIRKMNVENTQSQMRKGILEYCILGILNKGEAYPSEILEKLRGAQMLVVEGTVYPLLTRLKNLELLSYRWEESTAGPPRKYYAITPKGKQFFTDLSHTWQELQQAVSLLTQITKS